MLEFLAGAVVVLLIGPPLVLAAGFVLLGLAAALPATPRRVRERFYCPWMRRTVNADFLVAEGARHPTDLLACTAFAEPTRVTCQKLCRQATTVKWGVPRGMFPRWALTAGGPTSWREVTPASR
jgi:hypothetical protein